MLVILHYKTQYSKLGLGQSYMAVIDTWETSKSNECNQNSTTKAEQILIAM